MITHPHTHTKHKKMLTLNIAHIVLITNYLQYGKVELSKKRKHFFFQGKIMKAQIMKVLKNLHVFNFKKKKKCKCKSKAIANKRNLQ